ncbi:hypothetical protein C8R30_11051 [Nitrosomonas nitrosa]|jgi:FtsZ-interacting cell division protein ZipA|uniref:Uncharacterized protein n=1 Tax=Nitrosomonas nitrosa TaxID=52442 RepID=A0A1I4QJU4_9PROT|nr:hypothetical protein C8R30_11051 [Nitrosomonas nitrosa]SFM40339.1 hypothetical protein SAMN05421880_11553 [Nitrosomonas nitrosa]
MEFENLILFRNRVVCNQFAGNKLENSLVNLGFTLGNQVLFHF